MNDNISKEIVEELVAIQKSFGFSNAAFSGILLGISIELAKEEKLDVADYIKTAINQYIGKIPDAVKPAKG